MMKPIVRDVRLFFLGAYLSFVALFEWLQPIIYFATKIMQPLMQILFFTLLGTFATGPDTAEFYIVGNAIHVVAMSGVYGVTMSIGGDRWFGTLPYLFGTPANRLLLFLGRASIHLLDGMLGVGLGLAWGVVLFGLDLSRADPLALVLTVVAVAISTSGFGLMLGALSLLTVNVMFVNNLVYFLLLVFSGANIPISRFPAWMQTISSGLPLTRGIAAARATIGGASLQEVAPLLIEEVGIGIVFLLLGYGLFRWFESQAKRRGTLELI